MWCSVHSLACRAHQSFTSCRWPEIVAARAMLKFDVPRTTNMNMAHPCHRPCAAGFTGRWPPSPPHALSISRQEQLGFIIGSPQSGLWCTKGTGMFLKSWYHPDYGPIPSAGSDEIFALEFQLYHSGRLSQGPAAAAVGLRPRILESPARWRRRALNVGYVAHAQRSKSRRASGTLLRCVRCVLCVLGAAARLLSALSRSP